MGRILFTVNGQRGLDYLLPLTRNEGRQPYSLRNLFQLQARDCVAVQYRSGHPDCLALKVATEIIKAIHKIKNLSCPTYCDEQSSHDFPPFLRSILLKGALKYDERISLLVAKSLHFSSYFLLIIQLQPINSSHRDLPSKIISNFTMNAFCYS